MDGESNHDRVLVVGIDEAGYGPVLGPLVVSATAFEAPRDLAETSLWKAFRGTVSKSVRKGDRRIPVIDSKKLYSRPEGLSALERSALAFLAVRGSSPPGNLRALLNLVAPHVIDETDGYPWYAGTNPDLPLEADAGAVRIAGAMLGRSGDKGAARLAGIWCEPLFEGHFNRLVNGTRNKATVLLTLTLRLMQRVADAYPDRDIHFHLDKQGARDHYRSWLMQSFESRTMRIDDEGPELSRYTMRGVGGEWRIDFSPRGEDRHLPIALASIMSKYVREVFMHCFNGWWGRQAPNVAPTAGYYGDGQRFVREIEPHIGRLGIGRDILVRAR